jgi:UDP-N-acetylmuramate dehydrogenase
MKVEENVAASTFTTLRIGGPTRYLVEISAERELTDALTFAHERDLPVYILGGGSNILVADAGFPGVMIRPNILERKLIERLDRSITVRVGAGELLDDVVAWTVENGWWGIENMSFVPGKLGGAIIQNAGCYGQEIAEVVESVEVYDREQDEFDTLSNAACGFTYRHSIFNTTKKGRYVIMAVNLRLFKSGTPNLKYRDLAEHFATLSGETAKLIGLREVREAVIQIRKGKGQDPSQFWTAGSFFSNFKLTADEFEKLAKKVGQEDQEKEAELRQLVKKVSAPSDNGMVKVPAAWVLDILLGLKGTSVGGAELSQRQVLNVRNTGTATAADCMELFKKTRQIVWQKTGLLLVNEPELVGFSKAELDHYFML